MQVLFKTRVLIHCAQKLFTNRHNEDKKDTVQKIKQKKMEKCFAISEQVGYFIKAQKLKFLKDSFGLKNVRKQEKKECCSCPINLIRLSFVNKTRQLIKHKKYHEKNQICVIKFLNNIFKHYGHDKKKVSAYLDNFWLVKRVQFLNKSNKLGPLCAAVAI